MPPGLVLLVAFSLLPLACARGPNTPEHPRVKATELDRALELYGARRYDEAATAFAHAYERSGVSSALAGQAQSLHMAGQCCEAAAVYERFVQLEPDPTYNDNAIRSVIDRCSAR